ncbi:gamma-glutamyl-gamma-aminobutyrate hydrolase family protein [Rossellomorea oryzaecorticis]|uniref:Gamma-glutamyl-gamma-aminobutyrate hydrolase family protein n=1 Tax=Rossellomorea oryzaecorticis TaxID=1396505 RepID=A0ABW8VUJ6_9BACI
MTAFTPDMVGVTVHADEGSHDDIYPGHPLLYVERDTIELVRSVGLEPYLIPIYRDCSLPPLDHLKGLLFTGGGYLPLNRRNSQLAGLKSSGPGRYKADKRLVEYGLKRGLPMVGFCRGAQMINEVLGGRLASIPDSGIEHHQERQLIPPDQPVHDIVVREESRFYSIMGQSDLPVNSFHRQHMVELGTSLEAVALSKEDRLVEVFESTTHPFLFGFQFHPEKLWGSQPVWMKFFEEFASAAHSFKPVHTV